MNQRAAVFVRRVQSLVYATDEIRGKTGSAPSGAVLFGPFSYAHKKKDEEKKKVDWRGKACVCPERSSSQQLSDNRRFVKTL